LKNIMAEFDSDFFLYQKGDKKVALEVKEI
jgi:hypothetical protein